MKKILSVVLTSFLSCLASGQGGTWTWISGDSAHGNIFGVYGTQGMPSVNNHPPGLYEALDWKDKQGNFWLYGGVNTIDTGACDLWKYNPLTSEWTWVKGNGLANQLAIYGTKGVSAPANTPGARGWGSASWVDTTGNLWLFGGGTIYGDYNDLWEYVISTGNWTWVSGDSAPDANGVHGVIQVPAAANVPGAREKTCSAWTDSLNNLWLFGGDGYDDNGVEGALNDLWKYNIADSEWTWMNGSALTGAQGNYGVKGTSNAGNNPSGRWTYTKWKDLNNNFWMMGGYAYDSLNSVMYPLNDVWKYDPHVNEWTWVSGPNIYNDPGSYQHTCVFDSLDAPSSRYEQRSAVTDNCNRFWLFGGLNSANYLNDLWAFDPEQLKWDWLSGTNIGNQQGNYGMLGVPSPANMPPSRDGAVAWWGNDNKFYLFGGLQSIDGYFADMWVFNADTNCISSCNIYAGFQSNEDSICTNDCINFTNFTANATSWQWSFAGTIDSTSTDQNPQFVCYTTPGIYSVTLIASNSVGSDTLRLNNYITVSSAPPTPTIVQVNNDTLFCSTNPNYSGYQWYFDSTLVVGATDTFLVISQSGNYNVQVTNAGGCKTATGINIVLGLQNYMNDNVISLYPDPVNGKFTIYDLRFTTARLEIYNALGQVCRQSEIINPKSEIDVSLLPAGIYFIQLTNDNGRWVGRFVKE